MVCLYKEWYISVSCRFMFPGYIYIVASLFSEIHLIFTPAFFFYLPTQSKCNNYRYNTKQLVISSVTFDLLTILDQQSQTEVNNSYLRYYDCYIRVSQIWVIALICMWPGQNNLVPWPNINLLESYIVYKLHIKLPTCTMIKVSKIT